MVWTEHFSISLECVDECSYAEKERLLWFAQFCFAELSRFFTICPPQPAIRFSPLSCLPKPRAGERSVRPAPTADRRAASLRFAAPSVLMDSLPSSGVIGQMVRPDEMPMVRPFEAISIKKCSLGLPPGPEGEGRDGGMDNTRRGLNGPDNSKRRFFLSGSFLIIFSSFGTSSNLLWRNKMA